MTQLTLALLTNKSHATLNNFTVLNDFNLLQINTMPLNPMYLAFPNQKFVCYNITKSAEIHALYVFGVHLCKDLAQHNGHKSYGGAKHGEDDEIGAYLIFGTVHNAIRFQLLKTYHCKLKEKI